MKTLVHPTYFPSIAHYVVFAKSTNIVVEMEDNFQKQTYRNRTYIYDANGKLMFNIPIRHRKEKKHQKYKDIQIANETPWQRLHWRSLESAYRTSPFFEYYEDELKPLFEKEYTFLLDLNLDTIQLVNDCLQLEVETTKTKEYQPIVTDIHDFRKLATVKKEPDYGFDTYTQVFEAKHGFIPNLSILDLLFNEGTNALSYLEKQTIL
ncbi:WbqC family protein [Kordia sp. YSTF-M3]|uniref:WbqC family protein n=1 Tax=Kordia aestuariivivens TaxID=2759037 RepID=A0ABR7Q5C8_9FLAO|nr:WbqC family protein [Kordia aestuariivivens]MBC8753723.1 WbqC family protein [Kordia aestuariivivens]